MKRPLKLRFRIPPYEPTRNDWRLAIHRAATEALGPVVYESTDRLEVTVGLYFEQGAITFHDVDNRLKDVLDALQGRAGGPKSEHRLKAIIPNDCQVYRVIVEKREPPKQSRGHGHVTVRRLVVGRGGAPYNSRRR